MSLQNVYIIHPQDAVDNEAVVIPPGPLILPPPDVPLRVEDKSIDKWRLVQAGSNTYNVFVFGRPGNYNYRWATDKDALIVTVHGDPPAQGFRFETAGFDEKGRQLYTIGIFAKDLVLTYDKTAYPQLTFRPANGSSAQRFNLDPIFRN